MIIFHIGQHKTGSKALQAFFAHNQGVLLRSGILYPLETDAGRPAIAAYARSHFRLFVLVRRAALAGTAGPAAAEAYWKRHHRHCLPSATPDEFMAVVEAERQRTGATRIILSAEDLFDMQTAHELEFLPELVEASARLFAGLAASFDYDARVVVYLRRQDHLLGAQYIQFIKGCGVPDLDMEAFSHSFAPRLDTHGLLAHWQSAFGREQIHLRLYERQAMPGGIVQDFFQHVMKEPIPNDCQEPALDAETVNLSLQRDFVEYIRILNRRRASGRNIFDRSSVLEAALRFRSASQGPVGIAAWLSPAQRRALLARYALGNSMIARDFLGRDNQPLFSEPLPSDNADWKPYQGLSARKATAISMAILKTLVARQTARIGQLLRTGRRAG